MAKQPPSSRRSPAWRFFGLVGALALVVAVSAAALWRHDPAILGWVTFGYAGYELGVAALLVVAAWLGMRQRRKVEGGTTKGRVAGADVAPGAPPSALPLSVLIAAHNERACIGATLESVFAQTGANLAEVIVASDGSTDGMVAMLAEGYGPGREPRLRVLDLPKAGKGAALNAGLATARGEIVVTLDADTRLAPGALAALAGAFAADERIVSAGGFVYVRNARPETGGTWITRYQFWEYVKNFLWRIGLAHLGVCLQVSGAFGAFRTRVLREELGGFDARSLVEDYEVIYRLHERFRRAGRAYRVAVVPGAAAFTEGPETVAAFVGQRTRWFAGFLQTLWDHRRLVGDGRMGALGWFMLPVKCVDAGLPLGGFLSLGILLAAAAAGGATTWERAALGVFAAKWAGGRRAGPAAVALARAAVPRPRRRRRAAAPGLDAVVHPDGEPVVQPLPPGGRAQRLRLVPAPHPPLAPAALDRPRRTRHGRRLGATRNPQPATCRPSSKPSA